MPVALAQLTLILFHILKSVFIWTVNYICTPQCNLNTGNFCTAKETTEQRDNLQYRRK